MRRRKGHYSTRVLLHFKTLNRKSREENFSFVLQISAQENFWYIVLSFYFMLAVNGVMYNMLIWILYMWHFVVLVVWQVFKIWHWNLRLFWYFIWTILIYVQSSYSECIHYEIWVIIVLQNDYIHKIPFPANWTKMSRFVINRSNECFTASIIWWFDLNVRGRSVSSVLLVMLLL